MKKSKLGLIVKEQRQKCNFTQQHLADVTKLDVRTIQRLEAIGVCSQETLMAVADACNIDSKELLKMSDERVVWNFNNKNQFYLVVANPKENNIDANQDVGVTVPIKFKSNCTDKIADTKASYRTCTTKSPLRTKAISEKIGLSLLGGCCLWKIKYGGTENEINFTCQKISSESLNNPCE